MKFIVSSLFLSMSIGQAAKPAPKPKSTQKAPSSKRSSNLTLMYNAWAINVGNINGPGYLKSAETLNKDEYEALKVYFKAIATNSTTEFKTVQSIAQEQSNVYGLFNKLEAKAPLTEADVMRWKENLNKLHIRLLAALEKRVIDDEDYAEFLKDERERKLGNYQAAYAARATLTKHVKAIDDKNNDVKVELWSQVINDPHTEMLIRMRQGVEILHATFLDFEKQRFISPEKNIKPSIQQETTHTTDKDLDVDPNTFQRKNQAPYSEGPNRLLPPPITD